MKSLTHYKFNPLHKAILLSSVLISSMAIAKPAQNTQKSAIDKVKQAEIKKLKKQISQIKQKNQKKVDKLVTQLAKLEKSTQSKNKQAISTKKAKKIKLKKSKVNKAKIVKKAKKSTTIKNSNKAIVKSTAKKSKDITKKKGGKVLGADEISVEQLDLTKLLAGAKIETTQKPISQKIKVAKIKTIVENDNEAMLEKNNISNIKISNIKSEKNKAGSELYLMALTAFSDKNTDVAIHKLKEYVNHYPNGKLVAKAKYWLGESYLQKEPADYATARYYFLEVVDKHEHHPENNKKSKSLYRLCQLSKINNYDDELKKYTDMLKKKYPNMAIRS